MALSYPVLFIVCLTRWNLTGGASHKKYDPDMEKLIALLCGQCSGELCRLFPSSNASALRDTQRLRTTALSNTSINAAAPVQALVTRAGMVCVCAWMYLFKNYAVKDWMGFAEVYGMPLRVGKYASGASRSDGEALIRAVRSLGSDAAGIISKFTEIKLIFIVHGRVTWEW